MTHALTTSPFPLRVFICSIVLSLTLLAGSQVASAGPPAVDDGASGGGTATTGTLDESDRAIALNDLTDGVEVASGWPPTANERSTQLIESTYAPGGHLAGWDDIAAAQAAASEVSVSRSVGLMEGAEGEAALGEGETAGTVPRSIAMSEDKLAPGGHLADWDDIEATAAEANDVTVAQPHNGRPY